MNLKIKLLYKMKKFQGWPRSIMYQDTEVNVSTIYPNFAVYVLPSKFMNRYYYLSKEKLMVEED